MSIFPHGWQAAPAWRAPGRFWLSWPDAAVDRDHLDQARDDCLALVDLLSDVAPVTVLAQGADVAECALRTPKNASVVVAEHGTRPLRLLAPLHLSGADGAFALAGSGPVALQMAGLSERPLAMPLPGLNAGMLDVDGEGTGLAIPALAATMGRDERGVEILLADRLGLRRIIWLDEPEDGPGLLPARFLAPGVVAVPMPRDETHPAFATLRDNRDRLDGALDASGRPFRVVEMPCPRKAGGCYADCLVAGGLIVVPAFEDRGDSEAYDRVVEVLPDARVIAHPARYLAPRGGGLGAVAVAMPA